MFMKWRTGSSSSRPNPGKSYIIVLLCASLALTSGCALLPKEDAEETLPTIHPPKLSAKPEYTVKTSTLETKVRGVGKVMATKEEQLFFTDDGKRVKDVYFKSGDTVQKGQVIAELDVSDLESQLRQKKLQARKDELNMIATLRNTDGKSSEEIEQAKIDFELKQEDTRKLEEQMGRAQLIAPFSGTLVSVYANKGDTTKAYDTVAVLADLSELTIAATLSADDLKKVAVGMEADVDINAAGQQTGKVSQLPNPKAGSANGGVAGYDRYGNPIGGKQQDSLDNYLLVKLDKMPPGVARGTPLSVSVTVQKKENAVTIPLAALRTITGRNYVQVVDGSGNKKEVDVEIGQETSTEVEIVKGLAPGQKVVGR